MYGAVESGVNRRNDVLPTSLAVRAFGKVLNHGAALDGVVFELGVALLLTAVY